MALAAQPAGSSLGLASRVHRSRRTSQHCLTINLTASGATRETQGFGPEAARLATGLFDPHQGFGVSCRAKGNCVQGRLTGSEKDPKRNRAIGS